jgi:hypothetical protein
MEKIWRIPSLAMISTDSISNSMALDGYHKMGGGAHNRHLSSGRSARETGRRYYLSALTGRCLSSSFLSSSFFFAARYDWGRELKLKKITPSLKKYSVRYRMKITDQEKRSTEGHDTQNSLC